MALAVLTNRTGSPRLFCRVELDWNTNRWKDAIDTFPGADESVQSILVKLIGLAGSGLSTALPSVLQYVRQSY